MSSFTVEKLRHWLGIITDHPVPRARKVLNARDAIRRDRYDSDLVLNAVVERLARLVA